MTAIDDLRAALGRDQFAELSPPEQVYDWTRRLSGPAIGTASPRTAAAVAETLQIAAAHSLPVVTQGGNTGLVGGAIPAPDRPALILRTTSLTGVGPSTQNPEHLVAGSGATLADVQTAAVGMGRRYGVDLAARDQATIGGTVATNAGGIRVCAYGMTRDQVAGVECVFSDGRTVSDLVSHRRDNTGYALAQLLTGSEGTLAVITALTLRTVPDPGPSTLFAVPFDTLAEAYALVATVRSGADLLLAGEVVEYSGWQQAGAMLGTAIRFGGSPSYVALLEVADGGSARAIPEALAEIAVALDRNDQRRMWALRESQTEMWARVGLVHKFDVSLPPTALDAFVQEWRAMLEATAGVTDFGFFGHLADSNLHLQVVGDAADAQALDATVLGLVAEHGGSISAEHGIGRMKAPYLELRRSPTELGVMQSVKQALDPTGILNPGVILMLRAGWRTHLRVGANCRVETNPRVGGASAWCSRQSRRGRQSVEDAIGHS